MALRLCLSQLNAKRCFQQARHFTRAAHEAQAVTLGSTLDTSSPAFLENAANQTVLADRIRALGDVVRLGGSEKARARHVAKGKLLPRQRVERLLDPFSPFLELSLFAAHDVYEDSLPAAALITGIGKVAGTQCMIIANDATVKGGSYHPLTVKKHLRAQEIARENGLPCISLVESGGAALPHQVNVFPDKEHFGRIFYNMSRGSAMGLPNIAVVHGISVAGGAYMPAMADENIIVQNQGTIFLAGPPLVKAALGEVVDDETLGGGLMHSSESGVTDHLALSDEHAIVLARQAVSHLGREIRQNTALPDQLPESPLFDALELRGVVPTSARTPFDMREVIARIVDGSRFHEFKKEYGKTIVTGFAHIHGYEVGIIANNGILFSPSAVKAAHFIELCEQRGIPLVFLVNVSGYMVGTSAEKGGIAKDGAKMVRAVASATVPKLTVIVGGSFGAGNYGMCGRAYGPRFLWMWPGASVAVMGGDQLGSVMATISKDPSVRDKLKTQIERESQALYCSARLLDDGIILPEETRDTLGLSLAVCAGKRDASGSPGAFGVFRM